MPAHLALLALLAAALCSAAMMWAGVSNSSFSETAWAATAFAVIAILVGWHFNSRRWSGDVDESGIDAQRHALRRNGQVTSIVYLWGAIAMAAMYKLTSLYWQHGLQYAAGMLLFAAVIAGWAYLARPGAQMSTAEWTRRAALLNTVHGSAAAIAVLAFLVSGKLWADRPDWAANIVFLAGGVSITALCVLAGVTHRRLAPRD